MNAEEYVNKFFETAKSLGYEIETCQSGQFRGEKQIDFGVKKLHASHLRKLYPLVKKKGDSLSSGDFKKIVSGRPCAIPFFKKINKIILEKAEIIYYFAYGSNMDKEDLDKKCVEEKWPSIEYLKVTPVILKNFKLAFNYYSSGRGGGAANIMDSEDDNVYGLLIEIKNDDLNTIRKKEGYYGKDKVNYYDEITVSVEDFKGVVFQDVITYKVVSEREKPVHQLPTKHYINLIIKNAEKYEFPMAYITFLKHI